MKLTMQEFREHVDEYNGYCTACEGFTRYGMTEPDAREYECEECGGMTCMGAEEALLEGLLDVRGNDDDLER